MNKYTKEQIRAANNVDIAALLLSRGEKLKREGREFRWIGNKSVTINGNVWYDHATGEGGLAIDFIMKFMNLSFREAVKLLLDGDDGKEFKKAEKQILQRKPFELPKRDTNMNKTFAYLCQTRGIDRKVVEHFAHERTIYQSAPHGNVVFVGRDKGGIPRYAHSKSTNKDSKVRFDVAGSDKKYSFNHINDDNDALFVFESAIDMLSYLSIVNNWESANFIALGGLSSAPLLHFLDNNSQIKKVELCLDNDKAGQDMSKKLMELLAQMGYSVSKSHNMLSKDWNDELLEWREWQQEQTTEGPMPEVVM